MKTNNFLPEIIEKGTVIRTGWYTGSGRHTKAIDKTDEVREALYNMGWASIARNDAPRGGVGGNYVEVIGKVWSKQTLRKHVKAAIATGENMYRGCGVYRLAIKDGKIVAAIYGGYHTRRSEFTTDEAWVAECRRQMEKLGTVVKADGSGCSFFVRPEYLETVTEEGVEVDSYIVPNINGGINVNHEIKI